MKHVLNFNDFINESKQDDFFFPFDDDKYDYLDYVRKLITSVLGKQNPLRNKANWGGIDVWTIDSDDNSLGIFVSIDDNWEKDIILFKRTEVDEEYVTKIIDSSDGRDDIKGIKRVLKKALKMKK